MNGENVIGYVDLEDEDSPKGGFFRRNIVPIILGTVVGAGGLYIVISPPTGKASAPKKEDPIVMAKLDVPPPPPPPPPPPVVEKAIEQKDIVEKQEEEPPPDDNPAVSSNIKGPGPGTAGVGFRSSFGGAKKGNGNKEGKWDRFVLQIQRSLADTLRRHDRTKTARMTNVKVRIWADSSGTITRATLVDSSGDGALVSDVLRGSQLPVPPPADMPMPITLSISATRPN